VLRTALHCHGLCKIGPVRSEAAVGENGTVSVHAENCSPAERWTYISPDYGTGRTCHADESPSITLWAVGCSDYSNDGPTGTRRVAKHTIGEPIVSVSLAMNTSTKSANVDGVVAADANP
jgi:hypothetical protein